MSSNLVINVRCTCEEEFLLLHKLHKLYQEDQLRKRLKDRLVSVQGNGDGTKSYTVKCEEPSNPFDEKLLQQAVDGGVDAMGNPPLPEVKRPLPDSIQRNEITLTDVLEAEALENVERFEA